MKEFVVGKEYRCIRSERFYGVVFECVASDEYATLLMCKDKLIRINNLIISGDNWQVEDFEEVKEVKTRTDFRVGDRVYCMHHGWGVVINVVKEDAYPIHVEFNRGCRCSYRGDGRVFDDCQNQTLFFEKPIISNLKECTEKEEGHIITIDGKEVILSEESFQALKEQFR